MTGARQTHRFVASAHCLALASSMLASTQLSAQVMDARDDQSVQRAITDAPVGSGDGLHGRIDIVGIHDDNIFATRNGEQADEILLVFPSLRYELKGSGASLNLEASGELARYRDYTSEDYDDWSLKADGRMRLGKGFQFLSGASYRWDHENRASPDAVTGTEPTRYRRAFGYVGLVARHDRLAGRLGATFTILDYSNVPSLTGTFINTDRDRRQFEGGARLGYETGAETEIFLQAALDGRRYDRKLDDAGFRRDSNGFNAAAGIRKRFGPNLTGEVFVGFLRQDYDDPRLEDVSGVDFGAVLNWTGARNVSATFKLDRSVEETTLAGSSAYVLTSASLGLEAAASPRLVAGLDLTGSRFEFRGVSRSEFVMSGDLWVRYWLNPRIYIGADYLLTRRTSNAAGLDFDQNRFMLRIGAQLRRAYEPGAAIAASSAAGFYGAALLSHATLVTGLDGVRGNGSNTADFGDVGVGAGAALGYGISLSPLYLGLEIEGFAGGADWRHTSDRLFGVAQQNSYGVAGRLGYVTAQDDLLYGRLGIVSTRLKTTYITRSIDTVDYRRRAGLSLGVGAEASFSAAGFVRAEYDLTSYPDYEIVSSGRGVDNFSSSTAEFRLGLGFRLGRSPEHEEREFDFSGAYVGVTIGHGTLTSDNKGPRESGSSLDAARSGQGPAAGVLAGAGIVAGGFYLGGEIDADIAHLDWNIERDPLGRIYSVQHDWSFGVNALVGRMLSPSALLYGRVGAVRTRFDVRYATSDAAVRVTDVQTGLRLGAGLDVALGKAVRMRFDYSATDYGAFVVEYGDSSDSFDNLETMFRVGLLIGI